MSDSREAFESWYAKAAPCAQSVLPKLRDGDGYVMTALGGQLLISHQAWQHQQSRIDELEQENAALRAQLGQGEDDVTVLPDGSVFGVMSLPLPEDHWLYAEREYEADATEPKDLPAPILTHAVRDEVFAAAKYAIRAATNCGKESDFDPDALVQNFTYALCGPFNNPVTDELPGLWDKSDLTGGETDCASKPEQTAPKWYKREEIVSCLERMNYSQFIANELADWFVLHLQYAFNKGHEIGRRTIGVDGGLLDVLRNQSINEQNTELTKSTLKKLIGVLQSLPAKPVDERESFEVIVPKIFGERGNEKYADGSYRSLQVLGAYNLYEYLQARSALKPAVQDLPPFAHKVIEKLLRFDECASDPDSGGVDIGRHWLDLLTRLALLNRIRRTPALWEISQQGEDVLAAAKEGTV